MFNIKNRLFVVLILLSFFIVVLSVCPLIVTGQKEQLAETERISTVWWAASEGPWWIGNLIDIVAIFIGAALLLWQNKRQHDQSIKLQTIEVRKKLRLELFHKMSEILDEATEINYGLVGLSNSIDVSNEFISNIKDAHNKQIELLNKLSAMLEKHSIVSEYLNIFKAAFLCESNQLYMTFFPLNSFLARSLKTQLINDKHYENTLEKLSNAYRKPNVALMGYLRDLQIELQNIFLGDIFDKKVPCRKPQDPSVIVISTRVNDIEKLRETFKEYL